MAHLGCDSQGRPLVQVRIGGHPHVLLVDTSASVLVLHSANPEYSIQNSGVQFQLTGFEGTPVQAWESKPLKVDVGNLDTTHTFVLMRLPDGISILGADFFATHGCIVDFAGLVLLCYPTCQPTITKMTATHIMAMISRHGIIRGSSIQSVSRASTWGWCGAQPIVSLYPRAGSDAKAGPNRSEAGSDTQKAFRCLMDIDVYDDPPDHVYSFEMDRKVYTPVIIPNYPLSRDGNCEDCVSEVSDVSTNINLEICADFPDPLDEEFLRQMCQDPCFEDSFMYASEDAVSAVSLWCGDQDACRIHPGAGLACVALVVPEPPNCVFPFWHNLVLETPGGSERRSKSEEQCSRQEEPESCLMGTRPDDSTARYQVG
nr:PREDICTED: uncharacterized protein LOC106704051 [Latimeria chalumnae]|eukprot:XP_014345724.1 PREDICTED: uncharacterized protein LOC106704051 [Latimeria chalumnae]